MYRQHQVTEKRQPHRKKWRRPHQHIILIGMPGSGKSTIGKRLATAMHWDFVDTDDVLQAQNAGKTGELLDKLGKTAFMAIETKAVISVRPQKPTVIATGGSVVYSHRAMLHLRRLGYVVYLDPPLYRLKRRLGDLKARGVVLQPGQTLDDLWLERRKLYWRYADIVFETKRLSAKQIIDRLICLYRFMTD